LVRDLKFDMLSQCVRDSKGLKTRNAQPSGSWMRVPLVLPIPNSLIVLFS